MITTIKSQVKFSYYLSIIRLDHSTKHIFIIPGFVLAYLLRANAIGLSPATILTIAPNVFFGLIAAVSIASANYCINEYLDRNFDRYHPEKSKRASVQHVLNGNVVLLMWTSLVAIGLSAAFQIGHSTLLISFIFALQGIIYNVPPIRSKEKPYLDVISESINNPLRLMIGWSMVISYWTGGGFLMAAKRLSEFRDISQSHGREILTNYRASFAGYSETSLLLSCFIYALLSIFFIAVFLIKYRVEYLLVMPLIIILFGHYLAISMQSGSTAQNPEKLFNERGLMLIIILSTIIFVITTIIDIPILEKLSEQHFISFI